MMKHVFSALLAITLLAGCNLENAEPAFTEIPDNVSDLKAMLRQNPGDAAKLEIYYALYKEYRNTDPEQAYNYLSEQKLLAEQMNDNVVSGKASYNMGLIHKHRGEYVEAVDLYLQAIHHFEAANDDGKIAIVLNNLGVVFMETGNYEYATRFFSRAQKIYAAANDIPYMVLISYNLGICSFSKKQPNYDLANEYFHEALSLTATLENKKDYFFNRIYNYIGAMYYAKGDYEAAKESYLESIKYVEPTESVNLIKFIAYSNIGEAAMGDGNYSEARTWIEKALKLVINENVEANMLVSSYNILGELYQREGNHMAAINILEDAIEVSDQNIINPALRETLKLITISYKALNEQGRKIAPASYNKTFDIFNSQDVLEKELLDKTNFQALQAALGMTIALDNEREEKKAEMEYRELVSNIALGLGMLLILGAIIGFIYNRKYRKAKQENDEYLDTFFKLQDIYESEPQLKAEV